MFLCETYYNFFYYIYILELEMYLQQKISVLKTEMAYLNFAI